MTEGAIRFTEQQTAAITHPLRPLLIVAGAGSGKTSVMAARITHTAASVQQRNILGLDVLQQGRSAPPQSSHQGTRRR